LQRPPVRWLVVLGQASLFFYFAHVAVYRALGTAARGLTPWSEGLRYAVCFLLGLALLIPVSRWYRRKKEAHPRSVLRYL
jgi:surface polysaccharide O-acyltransferase-like enzyme